MKMTIVIFIRKPIPLNTVFSAFVAALGPRLTKSEQTGPTTGSLRALFPTFEGILFYVHFHGTVKSDERPSANGRES